MTMSTTPSVSGATADPLKLRLRKMAVSFFDDSDDESVVESVVESPDTLVDTPSTIDLGYLVEEREVSRRHRGLARTKGDLAFVLDDDVAESDVDYVPSPVTSSARSRSARSAAQGTRRQKPKHSPRVASSPTSRRPANAFIRYKNDLQTHYPEICEVERTPSQRMRIAARLWDRESTAMRERYEGEYRADMRARGMRIAEDDLQKRRNRSKHVTAGRRAKREAEGASLDPRNLEAIRLLLSGVRDENFWLAMERWDDAHYPRVVMHNAPEAEPAAIISADLRSASLTPTPEPSSPSSDRTLDPPSLPVTPADPTFVDSNKSDAPACQALEEAPESPRPAPPGLRLSLCEVNAVDSDPEDDFHFLVKTEPTDAPDVPMDVQMSFETDAYTADDASLYYALETLERDDLIDMSLPTDALALRAVPDDPILHGPLSDTAYTRLWQSTAYPESPTLGWDD